LIGEEPYTNSLYKLISLEVPHLRGLEVRTTCDFLSAMLQLDPKDRDLPEDLLLHRWFQERTQGRYPCRCGTTRADPVTSEGPAMVVKQPFKQVGDCRLPVGDEYCY
jgi:hypothetical protein